MNSINKIQKGTKKRLVFEVITFVIGAFIFSLGIALFITPGGIFIGGFTGISIIVNRLTSFPIGMLIMILNIPMFIIATKKFGFKFISKTILGVMLTSALIDTLNFLPPIIDDPMLCALFGGIIKGAGLGIMYFAGFTTGGSDLVLWLMKLRFPQLSSGLILFVLDAVVVSAAALIYRDPGIVLFSVIAVFSYTKVLDVVLGSPDRANLAIIITDNESIVAESISGTLSRGITVAEGKGWFSKESKSLVICVVDRSQVYKLKQTVSAADPNAFIILTDAREVLGKGFKKFGEKMV